jgi:hypothetical protein
MRHRRWKDILLWGSGRIQSIFKFCKQAGVYAPKGLRLDFLNITAWLFALPTPLADIIVGSGLNARMLRRLDPVSAIERR